MRFSQLQLPPAHSTGGEGVLCPPRAGGRCQKLGHTCRAAPKPRWHSRTSQRCHAGCVRTASVSWHVRYGTDLRPETGHHEKLMAWALELHDLTASLWCKWRGNPNGRTALKHQGYESTSQTPEVLLSLSLSSSSHQKDVEPSFTQLAVLTLQLIPVMPRGQSTVGHHVTNRLHHRYGCLDQSTELYRS